MVFPCFFLQFGLGGAGVQIVETRIFLRGTVMKASSHEKHAKQQWKKKHKIQKTHGQGLGRGLAGDMGLNLFFVFFCFSMVFCSLAKTSRKPKKTKKNKKFRPMGKVWAIHAQTKKPKKQKKQKTKKPKKQKNKKTKKTKKNKIAHPKGRGSDAECWVLSFFFVFFGFLFFCFFVFLFFCFLFFWFVCG